MTAADVPLILVPHAAPRVWGGRRFGDGIGEMWDLSVHPEGPTLIDGGPLAGRTLAEVVEADPEAFGGGIDLLAKRLDCAERLSVQVHPRERDAKTECWVVLEAQPGAGVYHGFRRPLSADEVARAARDGTIMDLLAFWEVRPGECVFVPAGTVHAIGGGLVLFELQQSSDVTYRLYDYGRGRELHLEEGLAVADLGPTEPFRSPSPAPDGAERLVACDLFVVDRVRGPAPLDPGGAWVAMLVTEGTATVDGRPVEAGRTVVVPAAAGAHAATGAFHGIRYGPA